MCPTQATSASAHGSQAGISWSQGFTPPWPLLVRSADMWMATAEKRGGSSRPKLMRRRSLTPQNRSNLKRVAEEKTAAIRDSHAAPGFCPRTGQWSIFDMKFPRE